MRATRIVLSRQPSIFLHARVGHRENAVKKVWWRMKQVAAANRLYGDLDALEASVDEFFGAFTPDTALRMGA